MTGDELDNILETADIMEEEAKEGESSPDNLAAEETNLSESMPEDLSVANEETIEFTDDLGTDELTVQLDEQAEEMSLDSFTGGQEPGQSAGEEDEVLSLELSDLDDVKLDNNEDAFTTGSATDNAAYDEISLGQDDEKELQSDSEASSAVEEIDEVPEELNELTVEGEEEITLSNRKEPEPEEVALVLPEAESEEEEDIVLEFPEDVEDGITEEITEDFVEADITAEQDLALNSMNDTFTESRTQPAKVDFTVEESVQELDEIPEEELEIPTVDNVMQEAALDEELLDLDAEELAPQSQARDHTSDDLETLEDEADTPELNVEALDESELSDLDKGDDDLSLSLAADNLGDIHLDIPDEEAETENAVQSPDLEEELEELDLEAHNDALSDEPEDLTLEISDEDQDMSEPEEISLDLPDDLEVEEDLPETDLADFTSEDQPDDLSLELVEDTQAEPDTSEDVTLAFDEAETAAALDETEELSLETTEEAPDQIQQLKTWKK